MVDVAFDLGNLAFVGSNLMERGTSLERSPPIAARKIDFMMAWKSKNKMRRFAKKCNLQHTLPYEESLELKQL